MNTKPKVQAGRKVKPGAAPSIRLPLPGRWLSKEAGPTMGQTAGDLGWREFEARAGAEGWGAWLRLGRGWVNLPAVDGRQGLRCYYVGKTKDTGYS